jgi:type II secretory pathway component PulF
MPTYQYDAMDALGQETQDTVEALNEEDASKKIRQRGLFVTKLVFVDIYPIALKRLCNYNPSPKDWSVSANTLKQVGYILLAFSLGMLSALMLGVR